MAVTPKGVRMINGNVVQPGLGLVVNDRNVMDWNHIPDGSLYINPTTGIMMTKVAGETDWIPAGIKNDGTLVISRDTSLHIEVFKIISINNTNKTFVYEDAKGRRQTKTKDADGFIFQLDGSYMPGRNHLTVVFDDVLERSAASGGIEELDEHRFRVKENLPVGTEVTAKYIQWVRIGNPYPRWYEGKGEAYAANAEVGDFLLDLNDSVEQQLGTLEIDTSQPTGNISWSRIIGTPKTLSGYGITTRYAVENHTHNMGDINGLNTAIANVQNSIDPKIAAAVNKLTNGTTKVKKAEQADTATTANSANTANTANSATTAQKLVVNNVTYEVDTTKAGGANAKNKIVVYDANGKIPSAALPKIESFVVGMIIDWFGNPTKPPAGWALCDGRTQNGIKTPNLAGKFIVCGSASGTYQGSSNANSLRTGGNANNKASFTIQTANLPPHVHGMSGRCTIKVPQHYHTVGHQTSNNNGYFLIYGGGGNTGLGKPALPDGVKTWFWNGSGGDNFEPGRWGDNLSTSYPVGNSGTYEQQCEIVNFNSQSVGSGTAISINTVPEYVVLCKIMYVGV